MTAPLPWQWFQALLAEHSPGLAACSVDLKGTSGLSCKVQYLHVSLETAPSFGMFLQGVELPQCPVAARAVQQGLGSSPKSSLCL